MTQSYLNKTIRLLRLTGDTYEDQFEVEHTCSRVVESVNVLVTEDRVDWAVPEYGPQKAPFLPYGKVHYLVAVSSGPSPHVIYKCTQNWDGGDIDLWRRINDEVPFFNEKAKLLKSRVLIGNDRTRFV